MRAAGGARGSEGDLAGLGEVVSATSPHLGVRDGPSGKSSRGRQGARESAPRAAWVWPGPRWGEGERAICLLAWSPSVTSVAVLAAVAVES